MNTSSWEAITSGRMAREGMVKQPERVSLVVNAFKEEMDERAGTRASD
jgi:hypothetical protein